MKIFLIHARAGAGHQKAAEALLEEFQKREDVGVLDIRLFDALEHTRFPFRKLYGFFYLHLVKCMPWLWGFFYRLTDEGLPARWMKGARGLHNWFQAGPLEVLIRRENPDLVIATHFLAAESASRLKREGKITSRVMVAVTDFMVHRFWVNEGADAYVAMMDDTRRDLIRQGVPDEMIYELGIPVSSRFLASGSTEALRQELKIEKGRFTILVTSGSFGSGPIREFVSQMDALRDRVQLIVVCGINRELKEALTRQKPRFPCAVLGFVNNMHELMSLADLMVSRPSGITTCESLVKGVPMVIISKIPGQEAHNAEILVKYHAAFEASDPPSFVTLVANLIDDPARLKSVKENGKALARPHASKEIVDLSLSGLKK